jgi:hypothetical protein
VVLEALRELFLPQLLGLVQTHDHLLGAELRAVHGVQGGGCWGV